MKKWLIGYGIALTVVTILLAIFLLRPIPEVLTGDLIFAGEGVQWYGEYKHYEEGFLELKPKESAALGYVTYELNLKTVVIKGELDPAHYDSVKNIYYIPVKKETEAILSEDAFELIITETNHDGIITDYIKLEIH